MLKKNETKAGKQALVAVGKVGWQNGREAGVESLPLRSTAF